MYYVLLMYYVEHEVVVTRKGQTTIPAEFRAKYGMEEGARLVAVDTGKGVLLKRAASTLDLAGKGSKAASPKEMKEALDHLRGEDQ